MKPSRQSLLFMLTMTVMMGLILSAIFTVQDQGFQADFFRAWLSRFAGTYVIVLPTVLMVAPAAQWLSNRIEGLFVSKNR